MKKIFIYAMGLLTFVPSNGLANEIYNGKVQALQITDTNNMQIRVILDTKMDNCNLNFAYIDANSPALNLYSAGLMTAYSQGKGVQLHINLDSAGFCRIYFINF